MLQSSTPTDSTAMVQLTGGWTRSRTMSTPESQMSQATTAPLVSWEGALLFQSKPNLSIK